MVLRMNQQAYGDSLAIQLLSHADTTRIVAIATGTTAANCHDAKMYH